MGVEGSARPVSFHNRLREMGPLLVALCVIALVGVTVRIIGDQLAQVSLSIHFLTQGAARYAAIAGVRLIEVVLVLAALAVLYRKTSNGSFAELGLEWRRAGALPVGIALTLAALGTALAAAAATGILRPERLQFPGPWPTLLALAAAIHAAVIEEIVFRGLVLQAAGRMCKSWGAILTSAALFTAVHLFAPFKLTPAWWLLVGVAGVGLGWLFYASVRNLWLLIGLHVGFTFGVFMLFGLPGETRGAVLWPAMPAAPALSPEAGWVLLLGLGVTSGLLLVRRHRLRELKA
jgi:membrane protease YdiL (CAAX protease family)